MHRSIVSRFSFLDLCCGRSRYCIRLEFTFVYVHWVQVLAPANRPKKMRRNQLCQKESKRILLTECHTRSALAWKLHVFVFTIFSSLCRPTDRPTNTHSHTRRVCNIRINFSRVDFLVRAARFARFCLFLLFFCFIAFSRSRDIFLYSQFVSLYLFSGHTLGNHNASINRRIELKLLAGFTQINWQFCMSKRSSPWAMSNAVCAFIFLCSSHRRTHFRCSKRIFVYFRHAIRLENTFGSCVCPQCIGVSSWSYKMYTLAVKIRYSPLRECAHWQPFGFSCRIDTKTKRKNGFSFGWMRFEGTNRIQGIYFAFQLHWRGPSIKIW